MKLLSFLGCLAGVLMGIYIVMLPKYDGVLHVNSSYGEVRIYRDKHAIPHIFADNEKAALFATGYVHAQDRIWTYEKFRRLSQGTWAEVLGDEALPVDYLLRQLNFVKTAKEGLKTLDNKFKEDYEAYVEGINEYLRTGTLPIEFYILGVKCNEFTLLEILATEKLLDFVVSYNYQMEIAREIISEATDDDELAERFIPYRAKYFEGINTPTISEEDLKNSPYFEQDGMEKTYKDNKHVKTHYNPSKKDIFEDVQKTLGVISFEGSNSWVISGNHTKSGKPILSSDPHLANSLPCLWHLSEVTYGNVTRAGASVLGLPYVMVGQTNHLAIGMTAIHSDVIDLYQETLVKNGTHYLFDGKEVPVKQRREFIKVRDFSQASGYRIEMLIINSTHHGPLIHDPFNKAYDFLKRVPYNGFSQKDIAMSWVGFKGESHFYSNTRCLNFAEDVHEAFECIRKGGTQNLNLLFADTKGNIGYMPVVTYPIRKNPFSSALIQDGSKSGNDWQGYVPFEEMPKIINPTTGFIANSNSMVTSQNTKYGIGALMPSTPRIERINEILTEQIKSGKKFTTKDMLKIQLDSVDVSARRISKSLEKIFANHWTYLMDKIEGEDNKSVLQKFKQHLHGWDANYHVDSTQASLFSVWEKEFHVSILADQIPNLTLRETIVNIHDSDPFFVGLIEKIAEDKSHLSKYCASSIDIYEVHYNITENKCLLGLAYHAVRAWKLLENGVSQNPNEWRWGAIHKHYYEHLPFSMIPGFKQIWHRDVEAAGSRRTITFALYDYYHNDLEKKLSLRSNFAANFRMAIDMASYDDPDKYENYMSIDTGISGSIFSPYYFDQNGVHYSKEGLRMELGEENAKKNAKHKLVMIPNE